MYYMLAITAEHHLEFPVMTECNHRWNSADPKREFSWLKIVKQLRTFNFQNIPSLNTCNTLETGSDTILYGFSLALFWGCDHCLICLMSTIKTAKHLWWVDWRFLRHYRSILLLESWNYLFLLQVSCPAIDYKTDGIVVGKGRRQKVLSPAPQCLQ